MVFKIRYSKFRKPKKLLNVEQTVFQLKSNSNQTVSGTNKVSGSNNVITSNMVRGSNQMVSGSNAPNVDTLFLEFINGYSNINQAIDKVPEYKGFKLSNSNILKYIKEKDPSFYSAISEWVKLIDKTTRTQTIIEMLIREKNRCDGEIAVKEDKLKLTTIPEDERLNLQHLIAIYGVYLLILSNMIKREQTKQIAGKKRVSTMKHNVALYSQKKSNNNKRYNTRKQNVKYHKTRKLW
jgi:hypothetical protein